MRVPGGGLVLYCKGADNIMFDRCDPKETGRGLLTEHLKAFASEGLRTLVLARRVLTPAEYADWNQCVELC